MALALNLGCSDALIAGHVNVDLCAPADCIADLRQRWPWADSSVDWIRAWDVIEHLPDKIHTMNEAHRILKRGGKIEIVVPTTDGRAAWQDPTHVSFWNRHSFWYYEAGNPYRERFHKSNGVTAAFRVVAERDVASADGPKLAILLEAVKPVRVVAFMPVYNEVDILPWVLRHMREQGIEVHALDGWSTDGSFELLQSFGAGVTVERFPADGPSDVQACRDILARVEWLAFHWNGTPTADWYMLSDADEWRRSNRPGETLADAIGRVDAEGFTCIDHQTFAFFCTDDKWAGNPEEYFRHFNTSDPICRLPQMKIWKNGLGHVDLQANGGHAVQFAGMRVYPEKFTMKHYPFRSPEQTRAKLATRFARRSQEEHAAGWGVHYDSILQDCWNPAELQQWRGDLTAPVPACEVAK